MYLNVRGILSVASVLVLLPAVAAATALDSIVPGSSTPESLAAELGAPVDVSDNPSIPVERFEAPAAGLKSVTAWFDDEGILKYAAISLVKDLSPEIAAILFTPGGAVRVEEGHAFTGAADGRTEHYDADGVHLYVAGATVTEIWRTTAQADIAAIRGELEGNADRYALVPAEEAADAQQTAPPTGNDDTPVSTVSQEPPAGPAQQAPASGDTPATPDASPAASSAWLGANIRALTGDEAGALGIPTTAGALVIRVAPGSPAEKSGILPGDVITALDKTPAASPDALASLVSAHKPGDFVTVHLLRSKGAFRVTVKLSARTPAPTAVPPAGRRAPGGLGFLIQPVTEQIAESNGLPDTSGALVSQVIKNSPAEKAGIAAGDIVVSFDGQKVLRIEHLRQILSATQPGTSVKIEIVRNGETLLLDAVVGELK